MSKGATKRMKAFVLAQDGDSASIAEALRALPQVKFAVDPVPDGGRAEAVAEKVRHDMRALLGEKFDTVVMGPDCEVLPHAVALAATAANLGLHFVNIEKVDPTWKSPNPSGGLVLRELVLDDAGHLRAALPDGAGARDEEGRVRIAIIASCYVAWLNGQPEYQHETADLLETLGVRTSTKEETS